MPNYSKLLPLFTKDNDLNNLVIKNIEALAEDEYYEVVIAALAAINVNLAFNSEESVIDLSLTSIMALARERLIFVRFAVMMLILVIAMIMVSHVTMVVVTEKYVIKHG